MQQHVEATAAGRGAAAGGARALSAALAVVPLAAAAGWLAVARSELFEVELPSSPLVLALVALALLAAPAAFLALLRRPALALALLVVFVYLDLSQVLVRFHGLPSLLQLLALPIAVAGLRLRGRDGTAAVATGDLTLALLAYLAVLVASTAWAAEAAVADERVAEMVKATAVFLLVALLAATPRLLRVACRAAVAAGALLAALGVWQAVTESFANDFGGLARIKQAQIYDDVFEPRIAGPLGDPNYFAQILLVLVPIALALAWGEGSWAGERGRRRVVAVAAAGLLVAGTMLTYSRGAALAVALVLGLAVLVRGVRPRHVAAGLALVLVLWIFTPTGFARRLTTLREMLPGSEEVLDPDSSFAKRRLVTGAAWRMFLDQPVLGVGAGNYSTHFSRYADLVGSDARLYEEPGEINYPHNLYLEVAAETGAVGLAAFGTVLIAAFASLVVARRRLLAAGDRRTAALADGVGLALVGLLVTGLFLHGEYPRYLYLLLGLTGGLVLAARSPGAAGRGGQGQPERDPAAAEVAAAAASAVRVRRPIAVFLSRFPLVTETFVLREVEQLERQGQPVRLVPLIRETPAVVHREAEPWVGRALYTPWLSLPIAAAVSRALLRRPRRLLGTLLRLVFGAAGSPAILWRSLALVPKSILLAERLESEGVRHLHAHFATHPATVALVAARLASLDFSFTVHAHDLFVDRHLLAWKLRQAAFVRVISRFNRDFIARLHPWAAEKLVVVHVGVDPEERRLTPAAVGEADVGGAPLVLCVAALEEYKGLAVLVDACRRLHEAGVRFRCKVVGEGPLRGELEARIAAAGLSDRVHLLGHRRQDEVARRMAAAHVVAQPSVVAADGQMEGIPVALMEALATERPVVASRLSGIPELVVHGETGLLVPPGDADALAAALRRLLEDGELGRRLGRGGRELVEREFSLAGTTAELLAVLDRHNPPPAPDEAELAATALAPPQAFDETRQAAEVLDRATAAPSDVALFGAIDGGSTAAGPAGEDERSLVVRTLEGAGSRAAGDASSKHAEARAYLGLRRFHRGRDSLVAEVLVPSGAGEAPEVRIAKRHLDRPGASRPAAERAAREAAVAARVAEWDGAPRPLALDAARGIVVFAPCPGEPLDLLVRRLRLRRDGGEEMEAAVGAAGRWLARYQATPLADLFAVPATPRCPATEALAVATAGLAPDARLRRRLARLRERALPSSFTPVPRHGDLWPGNLRIAGGVARALDFEGASLGPRYADAAWFLLHLDLFLARPGLGRRRRRLAAAFLAGWLGEAETADEAALAFFRAAAARHLLGGGAARGLRARWRRRLLARALAAAADPGAR